MNYSLINARLTLEGELTDIYVEDSVIKEIGKGAAKDCQVIDAQGAVAAPGFVDMHCSIGMPGYESIEELEAIVDAALASGYTHISTSPMTKPVADNRMVISFLKSQIDSYKSITILPYGSVSRAGKGKELADIGEMRNAGIVAVSDGGKTIKKANLLRLALKYTKMFNLPVITSCEDESMVTEGVMNEGLVSTRIGLAGMPREAEEVIVARDLVLCEHTGGRLHINSVSTKGSVRLIREAKQRGVNVTCDTSPHYFALTDSCLETYNTFAKTRPPLRTKEDTEVIIEGLLDGTIDVIASGHAPTTIEKKRREFDEAEFGISSLETVLPICYTHLVETGIMKFEKLIEKLSENPAKILGINDFGRLEKGSLAKIILLDLDSEYVIKGAEFKSRAKYTPFEGMRVKGKVVRVLY